MLDTTFQNITAEIRAEMCRQDRKWGKDRVLDRRLWLTVLTEEVGEVAHAILEHDGDNYREELIQVISVAIQMINSLDMETSQ